MLTRLELDEMRAWCDCPAKFQVMDMFGTGLAVFFGLNGLRQWREPGGKPWAGAQIFLASWMAYVHTRRFIYGSEMGTRWEKD